MKLNFPGPQVATPAARRKWALAAVVLVAGAVLLVVFNVGRLTRSIGVTGEPGTATVTDCHKYTEGKYPDYECHGTFRGADGTVHSGVRFEDSYRHDVGKSFQVRYDGVAKVSIKDIAISYPAPLLCAVAVLLLGVAAMLAVLASWGGTVQVERRFKIAGYLFLGGAALVVASLLVLVGSVMDPNV